MLRNNAEAVLNKLADGNCQWIRRNAIVWMIANLPCVIFFSKQTSDDAVEVVHEVIKDGMDLQIDLFVISFA